MDHFLVKKIEIQPFREIPSDDVTPAARLTGNGDHHVGCFFPAGFTTGKMPSLNLFLHDLFDGTFSGLHGNLLSIPLFSLKR
jgi:hypothetical protein